MELLLRPSPNYLLIDEEMTVIEKHHQRHSMQTDYRAECNECFSLRQANKQLLPRTKVCPFNLHSVFGDSVTSRSLPSR